MEVTVEFFGGPFDGERRIFGEPVPFVMVIAPVVASTRDGVPIMGFEETCETKPSRRYHVYELRGGRYVYGVMG